MAVGALTSREEVRKALAAALDACPARDGCSLAFDEGIDGTVVRCIAHGTTVPV